MDENVFYVGIKEPIQLRRLLLECSKEILQSLQDYEKIQAIREEKIQNIMQLKTLIKEIYNLNSQLGRILPKAQLRASEEPKQIIPSEHRRRQELDTFQNQLDAIEQKLDSLGI